MNNLINQLIEDEGFSLKPYKDTVGKITIGVGHNLTDNGLTSVQIMSILKDDINDTIDLLHQKFPIYMELDEDRKDVLINMCFNLGINRLLTFKKMIAALQNGDYITASKEMLHSKWAGQVGDRALRLSKIMRGEKS